MVDSSMYRKKEMYLDQYLRGDRGYPDDHQDNNAYDPELHQDIARHYVDDGQLRTRDDPDAAPNNYYRTDPDAKRRSAEQDGLYVAEYARRVPTSMVSRLPPDWTKN